MDKEFVTIAKIGKIIDSNKHINTVAEDKFDFEGKTYTLLLDIDVSKLLKGM